jgi:uncharacterized membrane protein YgaE (UPF0421/DUF939 family)
MTPRPGPPGRTSWRTAIPTDGVTAVAAGIVRRWRTARWAVVQTAVAAAVAWYLAHDVLGHPQPFFAPISAAVSLSASYVLPGQRALQLIGGVTLGIGIGVGVQHIAGTGPLAFALAAVVGMYVAVTLSGGFFGQGLMFVNQTAVSAILMIALHQAGTGTERLIDAVLGGGVVLAISLVLFPAQPRRLLNNAICAVFAELSEATSGLERHLVHRSPIEQEWLLSIGDNIQNALTGLAQTVATAHHIVTVAPRRWADRPQVCRAVQGSAALTLLARAVIGLVRASDALLEAGETVSPCLRGAISQLGGAFSVLTQHGYAGAPEANQAALRAADQAAHLDTGADHTAEATLILRACIRDTLRVLAVSTGDDAATHSDATPHAEHAVRAEENNESSRD